jgi:hypothetical protein
VKKGREQVNLSVALIQIQREKNNVLTPGYINNVRHYIKNCS